MPFSDKTNQYTFKHCIVIFPPYFSGDGELSGWMRYQGYFLDGHARKEIQGVSISTVKDCWVACLQEDEFPCLSLAYASSGTPSCILYETRALSMYQNWTQSAVFTYYEHCAEGK